MVSTSNMWRNVFKLLYVPGREQHGCKCYQQLVTFRHFNGFFHLELKQNEKLAVSFEIQSFSLLTAVILQYLTWLCAPSYNWGKPSITTVSTRTVFTACEFSARDLAEQSRISENTSCNLLWWAVFIRWHARLWVTPNTASFNKMFLSVSRPFHFFFLYGT